MNLRLGKCGFCGDVADAPDSYMCAPCRASMNGCSAHQLRVNAFMRKAGQEVPDKPTIPSPEVRLLRAKLIFEEAIKELVGEGLAVDLMFDPQGSGWDRIKFTIAMDRAPDLVKLADGACDVKVVITGTLSAAGIQDEAIQDAVDVSNLAKFTVPTCPKCGSVMEFGFHFEHTKNQPEWACRTCVTVLPKSAGGYRSDGTDGNPKGKWVKPADWKIPDIAGLLERQGN